ncbi:hypothetical protein B0H12DRAFT_1100505 [Mycena haematopus]|nr:hypothetical protein B0H12DRAFT_1100505 [Mycena haematopus]
MSAKNPKSSRPQPWKKLRRLLRSSSLSKKRWWPKMFTPLKSRSSRPRSLQRPRRLSMGWLQIQMSKARQEARCTTRNIKTDWVLLFTRN